MPKSQLDSFLIASANEPANRVEAYDFTQF